MFVRVPVTYETNLVRKGRQKDEDVTCGEWVDVHVVEVADPEAPVATRRKAPANDFPGGVDETRWFDGSHWSPVAYLVSRQPAVARTAVDLVEACAEGAGYANPLVYGESDARLLVAGKIGPEAAIEARSVKSSGREAAIEAAHKAASNLIFVDGSAWRRSAEPVVVAKPHAAGFRSYVSLKVVNADRVRDEDAPHAFSALRWDDAVEYARTLKTDEDHISEDGRIDVLVPESIRYDGEVPAALAALEEILGWNPPDITSAGLDEIVGWVAFRDAHAAARRDPSARTVDAAFAALAAHRAGGGHFGDYMRDRADAAVQKWELRPLDIEHDQPARLGR